MVKDRGDSSLPANAGNELDIKLLSKQARKQPIFLRELVGVNLAG